MESRRTFLAGAAGAGAGALVGAAFGAERGRSSVESVELTADLRRRYGIHADASSDDQPGLARLLAELPAEGASLVLLPGGYRLRSDLTIPRHVTICIRPGSFFVGGSLSVHGSIEAGLWPIFRATQVHFGPGSRTWAVPQWWGARGDGIHDDTDALQAALSTRILFVPAGKYRTTRELVVGNRCSIVGVGNCWNPNPSADSWIQYDGPDNENAAVLRVATAPIGVDPVASVDSVHVEGVVLNGGERAGYGLYSVYCTSDSSFSDITVRHCTQHGFFLSQQWHSTYRNLVARDNAGCGITIGRVFDGWEQRGLNGVQLTNLRAGANGSDERFHQANRPDWGYGVLFCPGGGSRLQQVVSEDNYGPGLIYDLGASCSNGIDGVYLEGNGRAAVVDGAADRPWGLIVIGHRGARANAISTVYLHGEVGDSRAQSVWLTGVAPTGDLVLRDLSFGQYLRAEWDRYRFEGFIYHGLRDYVSGSRSRHIAQQSN
jgi:hypothetical protein